MKTGLVLAGVATLLAAVYFISRKKIAPTLNNTQKSGNVNKPNPNVTLATALLTSQNVAAISSIFGGAAKGADAKGLNGTGLQNVVVSDPAADQSSAPLQIVTQEDLG